MCVCVSVCLFPITSHNPQSQITIGNSMCFFSTPLLNHQCFQLVRFIIYPSSHKHGFGKWGPSWSPPIFVSFHLGWIFHFHDDGRKGIHPFQRAISNSPEQGISGKPQGASCEFRSSPIIVKPQVIRGEKSHPKNVGKNHLVPYFKPPEVDITWVLIPLVWGKKNAFWRLKWKKNIMLERNVNIPQLSANKVLETILLGEFLPLSSLRQRLRMGPECMIWFPAKVIQKGHLENYRSFLLGTILFKVSSCFQSGCDLKHFSTWKGRAAQTWSLLIHVLWLFNVSQRIHL